MTGRLEEPPVWKISSHSMVQRQPTWDQTRCCFGKSSAQSSKLTTHLEQLSKKPGAKIRHCYVVGFWSKARVVFLSFFFGGANRLGFVFSKNRVWADRVSPVQTGFLGFGSEREKSCCLARRDFATNGQKENRQTSKSHLACHRIAKVLLKFILVTQVLVWRRRS